VARVNPPRRQISSDTDCGPGPAAHEGRAAPDRLGGTGDDRTGLSLVGRIIAARLMWSSIRHRGPARQALSARAVERHPIRRPVTTKKNEGFRARTVAGQARREGAAAHHPLVPAGSARNRSVGIECLAPEEHHQRGQGDAAHNRGDDYPCELSAWMPTATHLCLSVDRCSSANNLRSAKESCVESNLSTGLRHH
jgi:hypothetical protein